ncbi:glycoside hydrolase family 31 protein [Mucilaginibacter sp. BJC16-A38]|uniref:glycoside hydrolase family 31 protein n=1 Tax=Mucilaginibacter phenanthrenivorans TaxID=1234842 RepID=UPI0021584B57|nr:glycoside hydrolase family 31 protein [Mucilaginibacter phenanthrenivorans]MCR8560856.1 glycoside hydrolase family 31 protein [Mucilaginibacter phenanthrenivorans]
MSKLQKSLKRAILLVLALPTFSLAQSYTKIQAGIKANINGLSVTIKFYSPVIVRVTKSPVQHSFDKSSISVVKQPEVVPVQVLTNANKLTISSRLLEVELNLTTGNIRFFDKVKNRTLLSEKASGAVFTPVDDNGKQKYDVRQAFLLDTNEIVYGLGQQQNGKLSQRDEKIFLQQNNTKVCIPFIQSVKGYGLFWDNYSPTTYNDTRNETSFDSERGDCIDYYLMYGGSTDGVVKQMRNLTGQAPMKPLWAYGFIQSRERYKTQFELVDVLRKYRTLGIPIDGVVQDWQYWGADSVWNAQAFNPVSYPRPQAMADSIHKMHGHFFIVSWPGFGPKTPQFAEFQDKHMLINFDTWPPNSGAKPYDVSNPAARDIYWSYLNKGIFSIGPDAWWLDSTEPDHINVKESDWNQPTYLGPYRDWLNAFPLLHSKGVYEHQRKTSESKRVILLTRSAFAGQQRYGSDTWSGDLGSTWQNLKNQIPASLNFSLTGLPYWNVDIGGFFAGEYVKGGGARNPDFQELYVRWMQFSTFTPTMRSHGTDVPREIYQFGGRGEWPFDVQEKYINLRYSLLPYIYSTGWDVTHLSGSFLRPLAADFANDNKVLNMNTEFLFGKSILVAPVTDKGAKSKPVYLPSGTSWYDFWTGQKVSGGQIIEKETPIGIIPLYIKAGSIIPWGPKVQYSSEKPWNDLDIRIYAGKDASFTLYEDENDNYHYEKGSYTEIVFHWNDKTKTLSISDRKGNFPGMLKKRKFSIYISPAESTPEKGRTIEYSGKAIAIKF